LKPCAIALGYMAKLQPLKRGVAWRTETDDKGGTHKVPRNPLYGYKASMKKPESWGTLNEKYSCHP
jgi:hypothetical protein